MVNLGIYLDQIIRQTDPVFQKCLLEVRMGKCSTETLNILKACKRRKLNNDKAIQPTKLYSTRRDVSRINGIEIDKLKAKGNSSQVYYLYNILSNC